jgi:hypothetical protein
MKDVQNDHHFFWLFEDEDYQHWKSSAKLQSNDQSNTKRSQDIGAVSPIDMLVLSASPTSDLEKAASRIIDVLQDSKANGLQSRTLHFFYKSMELSDQNSVAQPHVLCIWSLLQQMTIPYAPAQQQILLIKFLKELIAQVKDNDLKELPLITTEKDIKHLFRVANDIKILWTAFAKTISTAPVCPNAPLPQPSNPAAELMPLNGQINQSLTLILDFNSDNPIPSASIVVECIRGAIQHIRKYFSSVNVLITNPPSMKSLRLQQPREILVVRNKERQGMRLYSDIHCANSLA